MCLCKQIDKFDVWETNDVINIICGETLLWEFCQLIAMHAPAYISQYSKLRSRICKSTEIPLASSPSIPFFLWVAPKGPFWPFFGPQGVKGRSENANLVATQKPHMKVGPTQLDY